MLTNTFCHIRGIGEKTEQALWAAGVTSWHSPRPNSGVRLPHSILESWAWHMQESIGNHANRNPNYFTEKLPTNQHWRLYGDFQEACAFLDIETTGLSQFDEITTIALYDGRAIRYYV